MIRKRLGVKKHEGFWFDGQKSDALYFFTNGKIMKFYKMKTEESGVSINWLLNDNCKIIKSGCKWYECDKRRSEKVN